MAWRTTGNHKESELGCKLGWSQWKCRLSDITLIFRKIDRRVRYLGKRLEELKIIDYAPEQDGKVYFGAWVEIENEEGEQKTLRIVGIDEIYDHHPQHISIESPMARALLGKEVDDEIEVHTPSGKKLWYINTIRYEKNENPEN